MNSNNLFLLYSNLNWLVFATKLGSGALKNGRDSNPKYRRVICHDGTFVKPGYLIITQCGRKFLCGKNCYFSRTFTIMANKEGIVKFKKIKIRNKIKTVVSIV
jgi:large subunit ribosomal protein L27